MVGLDLPAPPWLVGHRGASEDAPENSLESLSLAVAQGADMAELDLRLTADGHLVSFHDADLERLSGSSKRIEELTLAELSDHRVDGDAIPSLADVFDRLPVDYPLNLELKLTHADPDRFVAALMEAVGERGNLLISSFDAGLLTAVRAAAPELPLAPLARRDLRQLLSTAADLGATSVHCHRRMASPELVAAATSFGWPVLVYTVNDMETAAELLGLGVAGLFTDAPKRLRGELASILHDAASRSGSDRSRSARR